MSVYDNETKIYPVLNLTAPQEPQTYRLNKLSEIGAYCLYEIEHREQTVKKNETIQYNHRYRRHRSNYSNGDHRKISIAAFVSGVGLPVSIALSENSLLLSLATAITQKSFKIFTVKQEQHDAIKLLVQSKLDSITNTISQAIPYISPTKFHKVQQEVEKYRKLKADIRNQIRAKVKEMTKKQREEILEQGRKEDK